MLSEYEVRHAVAVIDESDLTPMGKTRQYLALSKALRLQQRALRRGEEILAGDLDFDAAARLQRLERQQERLIEDVRLAALHSLQKSAPRLGFDKTPPPTADLVVSR